MKKIILGSFVLVCSVYGDIVTILPYTANIDYDSVATKSSKKEGTIIGVYTSIGNLNYLLEFDYVATNIKYKDANTTNLKQDDITLTYSKYYKSFMLKGGIHHINTTDKDLCDANVIIGAIGGYQWSNYDKYSYGLESYYSQYKDGHDENEIANKINIFQITPYYSYSKAININTRNIIGFKLNYIIADDYKTKNYTSYEIADTLYYKKFFTIIKVYCGKMKTGVKDSGNTVYNSKDLLKDGYNLKLGYNIQSNLSISTSYAINNFEEYGLTGTTSNKVVVATLRYSF